MQPVIANIIEATSYRHCLTTCSFFRKHYFSCLCFFSVRPLSVLRGHSVCFILLESVMVISKLTVALLLLSDIVHYLTVYTVTLNTS